MSRWRDEKHRYDSEGRNSLWPRGDQSIAAATGALGYDCLVTPQKLPESSPTATAKLPQVSQGRVNQGPGASVAATIPKYPPYPSEYASKLSPLDIIPPDAITVDQAITFVGNRHVGRRAAPPIGPRYPNTSALAATYTAEKSSIGPAADHRPVWVVTFDGYGHGPVSPAGPALSAPECYHTQAGAIVDAITRQELSSWDVAYPTACE